MKKIIYSILIASLSLGYMACSPAEDDSHSLGGSQVSMPADWTVTVIDNDNEVVINYASLEGFIDGDKVQAVQFDCKEAGISFSVRKGESSTSYSKNVYFSGDYVLYVAAVSRAGAGEPRAVPFTVVKSLMLETLSESTLPQTGTFSGQEFHYAELYIEKNSFITLEGSFASDELVLHLEFFQRLATNQAQFLGESGLYTLYYDAVRRNVLIGVPKPDYPDYLITLGKGFAYPSKTTPFYATAYPQYGSATDLLTYTLWRKTGDNTFQTTVMLKSGAGNLEFKAFLAAGNGNLTNNWGQGGEFNYANLVFSGTPNIFVLEGTNWGAGEAVDEAELYRVTLVVTDSGDPKKANVNVQRVTYAGEVLPDEPQEPEEPQDPDEPIESNNFDLATAKHETVNGEMFHTLWQVLEKDAEYTLRNELANAAILFNVDFFERISASRVKFLGESGTYKIHYNPIRRNIILLPDDIDSGDFLLATGVGLGYPTGGVSGATIGSYYPNRGIATSTNFNFEEGFFQYFIFRQLSEGVFQATLAIGFDHYENGGRYWWDQGPYFSFKVYEKTNWDGEMGTGFFTGGFSGNATDIISDIDDGDSAGDWNGFVKRSPTVVRITVNVPNKSVIINTVP
jgi:hypothetical protein